MGERPANLGDRISESIKQKAKNSNEVVQDYLQRFAMERFLVRLGKTDVDERMMLKGGMLWHIQPDRKGLARTTVDLDVHFFDLDKAEIDDIINAACTMDGEDGASVTITRIKDLEHAGEHGGVRYVMQIMFGRMRTNFHVDVGFGGYRPSGAKVTSFNSMHAALPGGALLMAPLEYQMAEKVHAIWKHGFSNTRMKDFADLYAASSQDAYNHNLFARCLIEAFENSGDELPGATSDLVGLSDEFVAQKCVHFENYLQTSGYGTRVPSTLEDVMSTVRPVIEAGLEKACDLTSPETIRLGAT